MEVLVGNVWTVAPKAYKTCSFIRNSFQVSILPRTCTRRFLSIFSIYEGRCRRTLSTVDLWPDAVRGVAGSGA
ncbi:hypothetical protein VNO77_18176 [Canavalia gladiata]|uniref:Uncharacterized protein n=1 Tax=Canavalia gladiata TaxID=3824 RepID=A0AAN9QJD4_CANGL